MADIGALEAEFNREMVGIINRESEVGLNSTRFRAMVAQFDGVETAHRLLRPDRDLPQNTFTFLRRIQRLDLSLEFYVVMAKYEPLFSEDERKIAKFRLDNGD